MAMIDVVKPLFEPKTIHPESRHSTTELNGSVVSLVNEYLLVFEPCYE